MKITIERLTLTNFKCFRHKEISFNSDVTVIRGRNGVGKTTIADAVLWCLFGKNTQGQSDFDLKTHDENGKPIPNLDHSVEMSLSADGSTVTLKRTVKEVWIKRRGSDEQVFKNNTTEYMVNGEVVTATDYKKFVSSMVSEDIFRAITNPSYFPSLKWQQQREFLNNLAGDIDLDTNDVEFVALLKQLTDSKEDIIAYRKHLSYQIKQIKDKLDKVPVRLEEQNKALPERLDWSAIEVEYADVSRQQKELESKISSFRSGNGDDIRKEEIRKQLDEKYRLKRNEEERMQNQIFEQQKEYNDKITELTNKFRELLNTKRDLENTIPSFDTMIARCNETLDQCERDAEDIRKRWAENLERKIVWDDSDIVCPTCGQPLPDHQVQESRKKAVENLNSQKAEVKKQLRDEADKVKKTQADTNQQIKDLEAQKAEQEQALAGLREQTNKVFSEKQRAEKEKESLPVFEMLCKDSMEHKAILLDIATLEAELQTASTTSEGDAEQIASLEAKAVEYAAVLQQLNNQLATKSQYDKIQELIEGIHNEERDLVSQLSELERKEDVARRYQDRQNAVLESRINEHFSLVQWRMFRTVNNGGDPFDEPYCECYVDGVAYHDGLNQAARLNAGLDIINTLCKHYNVSAPIVVDNSESNLNILPTESQQIRLEVFDSELSVV